MQFSSEEEKNFVLLHSPSILRPLHMFLLWAAIKWSPLHPMVSVPLSIVFSVTPPFHSPCKLFAAHIHHFFPFSIQFCPDTLTFYPFSVLPNLHLCSPLTIALSSTFLSYISHSWFFSFLPTSSFSSFNLSAHRTQWLNVSQKHTARSLSSLSSIPLDLSQPTLRP